jgi:glycosyltransferase involved in cell wall biosynthesis/O-antigen/teichoic acid export membrane protein
MKTWSKSVLTGSGLLVSAMMVSNVLNLLFSIFLGRHLSFKEFGIVAVMNTLWYLINIFISALSTTITHRIAYISSKYGSAAGSAFFKTVRKKVIVITLVASLIYIAITPYLSTFFHIENMEILFLFTPVIIAGSIYALNRGFLSGNFFFVSIASLVTFEALSKLFIAIGLVYIDWDDVVFLAIPLSLITAGLLSVVVVHMKHPKGKVENKYTFPAPFYIAALITGLSQNIFLSLDITLTKHFLSPEIAGQYAVLALVGKMIYFLGTTITGFIVAFVGRDEGSGRSPMTTFYRLLSIATVLIIGATITLGWFGDIFVPLVFGARAHAIVPYLKIYSVTIAMFTIANAFVMFHLARKQYSFPVLAIIMGFFMTIGILSYHQNIGDIIRVMFFTSIANILVLTLWHLLQRNGGFFIRNIIDFLFIFVPLPKTLKEKVEGRSILIMNWRDTKHVFAGGAEVYIHELAKRWVQKGHQVTLFCGNDGKGLRYEIVDGVQVIRRGGFYFVYVWAFLYYILRLRGRYDVIIDCENGIPFFTPLYAREKVILLIHHVHQDVFTRTLKPPFSWFASFLELKLMPYAYKKTHTMTVSPSSSREILEYGLTSVKPSIVYNGVDLNTYIPAEKAKKPTVLYLGRLKYYKSVHIFLKAAAQVLKKMPDVEFIVAGDGEENTRLRQLASRLGISASVTFTGKVEDSQKIELYQQAWVFVNPSFMEGWGITSIEANACGTPVIASDVPGLRDSVREESGVLVPFGEVEQFAEAIIEMLSSKKKREELSVSAQKWAARFDWNKSASKGLEVIEKVISEPYEKTD